MGQILTWDCATPTLTKSSRSRSAQPSETRKSRNIPPPGATKALKAIIIETQAGRRTSSMTTTTKRCSGRRIILRRGWKTTTMKRVLTTCLWVRRETRKTATWSSMMTIMGASCHPRRTVTTTITALLAEAIARREMVWGSKTCLISY